jgi:hypothetical protein
MRYYKRSFEEVIKRFNKKWTAIDWYYFEVGVDDYPTKQIQVRYDGNVFKYDEDYLESYNGGLAEGALNIEEYTVIEKEEFLPQWEQPFTNTYLVEQLNFDNHWKFAWNNIYYNKTEQQLYDTNQILCGTYKDIYLLAIARPDYSNYLQYEVKEGTAHIKYGTADNWDELVACVQLWIEYIQTNASTIYSKKLAKEKLERIVKVSVNGNIQTAFWATYRNMDWEIEKFRGDI